MLRMKRILILGISGAGKSTLASILGTKLKLPIYFLDKLFWKPGWQMPGADEWESQLKSLAKLDVWIIDGNYVSSYSTLMPRAELIVIFDIPRYWAIYRVLKRSLLNRLGLVRAVGLPLECPEKIDIEFLRYIWNFPRDRRPAIDESIQQFSNLKNVRIIKNQNELRQFISEF